VHTLADESERISTLYTEFTDLQNIDWMAETDEVLDAQIEALWTDWNHAQVPNFENQQKSTSSTLNLFKEGVYGPATMKDTVL